MVKAVVLSVATAAVAAPGAILAQEQVPGETQAVEAGDGQVIEEVIVTANRRAVALQDVAGAVSALTDTAIEEQGITEFADFVTRIPGVNYQANSSSENEITIRGVSLAGGRLATVAIYIDEMPVTGSSFEQPGMSTFDVERVEVLRGPQGTLYGEASLGGTMKFIYHKPWLDEFAAKLHVDSSSTDHGGRNVNAAAMFNIPLVPDKAGLRLSVQRFDRGGYIDHNRTGQEDINGEDYTHVRASARFLPRDGWTVDASYIYRDGTNEGQNITRADFTSDRYLAFEPFADEYGQGNLTLTYESMDYSAVSSTSFWEREQNAVFDLPVQVGLVNNLIIPFGKLLGRIDPAQGPVVQTGAETILSSEIFTQELRVSSETATRLQWTAGLFYRSTSTGRTNESFSTPATVTVPAGQDAFLRDENSEYKTFALFGEVNYDFTDRLTGTVGLRWYSESRDTRSLTSGYTFEILNAVGVPAPLGESTSDDEADVVNPKFNLSYSFLDDHLAYATISKGFRGGGNNSFANFTNPLGDDPETYGPDELWNYEIGTKSRWGRLFTLNLAAFFIDWQDAQVAINNPISGFAIVDNAGTVETRGIEIEAVFAPRHDIEISLAYGKTDAEVKGGLASVPDGTQLGGVADYNLNVGANYSFLVGSLEGVALVNVNSVGGRLTSTSTLAREVDAYSIANLSVAIRGQAWSVTGYANNVADNQATLTSISPEVFPTGVPHFVYYQPRTIGFRIVYDW